LQKAGIAKDVTIVQAGGISESAAALSSGAIAATTVLLLQSLMLKEKGFRELVGLKELKELNIPFVENGLAVRRSFANKNPDVIKRFLKASLEGLKRVLEDKNFTTKILGQYTKITDPKLLEDIYQWATPPKTPTTAYFDSQDCKAPE